MLADKPIFMYRFSISAIFTCLLLPLISIGQSDLELGPNFKYRNIGPANQGGRISDIEASPKDYTKVYAAVASGGVWKSSNAGTTWSTIFDDYETASIGDIALDPNNDDVLWVGTGEANNRNSVSWGNGIYKTEDGGKTFTNKGLESTHQIARVNVNPEDSEDVCVCAIGHLWGYSGDRGLFQTKDGGDSWNKLGNGLPDDGKTGCIDLVRDPSNSKVLYAAFYHRLRKPWTFNSGGGQGGIYKSTNGGESWKKLSDGLPQGATGRIGLAIYEKNPAILMAIVEAEKTDDLAKPGSGIYRSEDAGKTWKYVNLYNKRPFYYSQIRINPSDDQRVYVLTTQFMVSEDGGKTFVDGSLDQEVHGDFHALWIDPKYKNRYYLGADKGMSITHDHGQAFILLDNMPIAQFYRINYDMRDPYYVYGGLQDNGSYATASFSRDARGILNDSNWKMHWGDGQDVAINPFDYTDMYSSTENSGFTKYNPETRNIERISPNPTNTINYYEYFNKDEQDMRSASRYNWSAPIVMSTFDPHTLYIGGNHLYKTTNQGKSWTIISPDLTTNDALKRIQGKSGGITPDNTGAETHCAITNVAPSSLSPDLIWVGTDDGNVQITRDGGASWKNVRTNIKGVPDSIWVSKVEASKFKPGVAYVSFDGHRSDDFGTYLYKTEDYGKTWSKITNGFSTGETIRVIREDVKSPNLLFAGTETGVWMSLDQGSNWERLKINMPTVSIYDLRIHERNNDLIVGSHGRSLWILDDISPLQEVANGKVREDLHLFKQATATLWENRSRGGQRGHFWFAGDNLITIDTTSSLPRAKFRNLIAINYAISTPMQGEVTLRIESMDGKYSASKTLAGDVGIHKFLWDRKFDGTALSEAERLELFAALDSLLETNSSGSLRRITAAVKETEDSDEIRSLIDPIINGGYGLNLDDKFMIDIAGPGTYKLELISGRNKVLETITIREDPLLSE